MLPKEVEITPSIGLDVFENISKYVTNQRLILVLMVVFSYVKLINGLDRRLWSHNIKNFEKHVLLQKTVLFTVAPQILHRAESFIPKLGGEWQHGGGVPIPKIIKWEEVSGPPSSNPY